MKDVRHSISLGSKRFVHQIRRDFRNKGYAYQTEKTYIHWIKRFIRFHKYQHPESMGATHINQFLSFLGSERHCSPATQRIALNALVYLYRNFLQRELKQMQGHPRLMVELLYGSGLRLNDSLNEQITRVEKLHRRDLEDGYGEVYLPYALARKYPNASRELGWRRHGSYQPAR
jgi:site-specific recombinase XerD